MFESFFIILLFCSPLLFVILFLSYIQLALRHHFKKHNFELISTKGARSSKSPFTKTSDSHVLVGTTPNSFIIIRKAKILFSGKSHEVWVQIHISTWIIKQINVHPSLDHIKAEGDLSQ